MLGAVAFRLVGCNRFLRVMFPPGRSLPKPTSIWSRPTAKITANTDQITILQVGNEILQNNLYSNTLCMYVIGALSGVRGASLAVATDDYAGARLSLIQASEALDALSGLLETDQKDVLTAMQESAAQALTDVQNDLKSAQPELDQLTKNLVQLENNLFPDS